VNNRQTQQLLRLSRQTQATQPVRRKAVQKLPAPVKVVSRQELATGDRRHPLADQRMNARLAHCEESVKGRFEAIVPALKALADLHTGEEFVDQAQAIAQQRLGYRLPETILERAWINGLEMRPLYAWCAFQALQLATEQFAEDLRQQVEVVQDIRNFFLDCGFHAVDISPCADGRLKGLMRYILRLPLTSFARRKAYAGAMFDVETDVRHWIATELRRFREGVPSTIDAGTRYLKVAVYHYSEGTPHEGCAAHGSHDHQAVAAALERLGEFRQAIENTFCCGASTDILLIGVNTDNDAIRIHIPDSQGDLSPQRYIDNSELYRATLNLSADAARIVIHDALNTAIHKQGWGMGQGEPHDGMRRLVVNLLINNLSQIDYVADLYDGCYSDIGHAERYISVGDGFEEVQIRNIAYYAHLHTLEEGMADMDIGIKIFKGLNVRHGLPIPVAVHYHYDGRVPGSRARTVLKAQRVANAIRERYADLVANGMLYCHLSVQDQPMGSPLEIIEDVA
jgi:carboxysome shell carbonic anhydrase